VPNTLLTPTVISNELLRRFKNNLTFAANVTHEFDEQFNKIGDTYNMRVPVKLQAVKSATLSVQDVTEVSKPLQLTTQAHSGFQFTSKDLSLTVDRFGDRYLSSAAVALANTFEADGLAMAYQNTFNTVGTPGTTPTALRTYKLAASLMDKQSAPFDGDRTIVINPDAEVEIIDTLKTLFQSSNQIKNQYEKGRMGTAMGADWSMDQNVPTHTVGPLGGAPIVSGASQTGSSLLTSGWTAAAASRLKKGDVFTIANVLMCNPVSGAQYANLQQFVVTADVSSDASGNATIPIYPPITPTGAYKTVSASPAASAPLTILGAASALTPQNLVFHKEAFAYATAKLELPSGVHFAGRSVDKDTGLNIRIVSSYDIVNDLFITRADILYGWAPKRNEWSARIAG
jgi:P22 coat protein - gene protein 5